MSITDTLYVKLKQEDANGNKLTDNEKNYIEQMDCLEMMSDFRPDWYPPDHKARMIHLMKEKWICPQTGE